MLNSHRFTFTHILAAVAAVIFLLLASTPPSHAAWGDDCQIPAAGPWPACATGGNSSQPWQGSHNGNDCQIPPSGPWPACATGGTPPPSPTGCTIPWSGPWPACATGGNSNIPAPNQPWQGDNSNDCVIPAAGPWPACATGQSSVPLPASAPTVRYFDGSHTEAMVGDMLTFWWQIDGDRPVRFVLNDTAHPFGLTATPAQLSREAQNTMRVPFYLACKNVPNHRAIFRLQYQAEDGSWKTLAQHEVKVTRAGDWFFSYPDFGDQLPCRPNIHSATAFQQFEHGMMVWIRETDEIYVMANDASRTAWRIQDTWDVSQPEDVATVTPPTGMQRPIRGFGKVWRENAEIRNALGFATGDEQPYTSDYQFTRRWVFGRQGANLLVKRDHFRLPNGDLVGIENGPARIGAPATRWSTFTTPLSP